MTTNEYDRLHAKLAIRKALLHVHGQRLTRNTLFGRFLWLRRELFDAVVDECLREGTLVASRTPRNTEVLTWHEENVR